MKPRLTDWELAKILFLFLVGFFASVGGGLELKDAPVFDRHHTAMHAICVLLCWRLFTVELTNGINAAHQRVRKGSPQ